MTYQIIDSGRDTSAHWEYPDSWNEADITREYEALKTALKPNHRLRLFKDGVEVGTWPPIPSEAVYSAELRMNGSTRGLKVHVPAEIVEQMDLKLMERVEVTIRRV